MFHRIYKPLLGIIAVFIAVWACVLMWWSASNRMPDAVDVVTNLVLLPIVLLLGFWILRKTIDALRAGTSSAEQTQPAQSNPASSASATAESQLRSYRVRILKAGIRTPVAAEADGVWDFLAEGQSKQDLDADLLESEGVSAFVAKIADLNTVAVEELLATNRVLQDTFKRSPGATRTVQMLNELIEEFQDDCLQLLDPLVQKSGLKRHLDVRVYVSRKWEAAQCVWFTEHFRSILDALIPAERITVSVVPVSQSIDVLRAVDELNVQLNVRSSEDVVLVLAADSLVATDSVLTAHARGEVLGASRNGDTVPGEAAAAVLICRDADDEVQIVDDVSVMSRLAVKSRDNAARGGRLPDFDALRDAFRSAVEHDKGLPGRACAVISDVDRKVAAQAEVMRFANAELPDVEAPSNCVSAGMATGYSPVSAGLVAMALAHSKSVAEKKSVLLVSVQGDFERGAAMIDPLAILIPPGSTQSL